MLPKYDYTFNQCLETILEDKRLKDTKYNGPSSKYVKINCGTYIYQADGHFLKGLLEKYGNVRFDKALQLWRKNQCA